MHVCLTPPAPAVLQAPHQDDLRSYLPQRCASLSLSRSLYALASPLPPLNTHHVCGRLIIDKALPASVLLERPERLVRLAGVMVKVGGCFGRGAWGSVLQKSIKCGGVF